MKYLDNAPIHLICQHQLYIDGVIPASIVEKDDLSLFKQTTINNNEILRRKSWRNNLFQYSEESFQILGKLLTDERMNEVWTSLNRRNKSTSLCVWDYCQKAIYMWRGIESLTPAQRKKKYEKIFDTAQTLKELIYDSHEFDSYQIDDNFDYDELRKLSVKDNNISKEHLSFEEYLVYLIQHPDISDLLDDIALKAQKFSENIPLVKQPNSPNPHIHYFVRSLSNDIYQQYKERLHNVVAIITSVIFDITMDENHVSKTVKMI